MKGRFSKERVARVKDASFNEICVTLHSRSLAATPKQETLISLSGLAEIDMMATPPGLPYAKQILTPKYTDIVPEVTRQLDGGGSVTNLSQFIARFAANGDEGWAGCTVPMSEAQQLSMIGVADASSEAKTVQDDFRDLAAHMQLWGHAPTESKNKFRLFVTSEQKLLRARKELTVKLNERAQSSSLALTRICSVEDALDFIDLSFKRVGVYLYNKGWEGNKWESYYLQTRRLVPGCYKSLAAASPPYETRVPHSPKIVDHLEAVGARFGSLLACRDLVGIADVADELSTSHFDSVFALGYFMPLVTGIFDSLAWITVNLLEMKLPRGRITLRLPQSVEDRKGGFHELLEKSLKPLHDFIVQSESQSFVEAFYPLRDIIQHRTYLHGADIFKLGEDSVPRIGIELDENSTTRMDALSKTTGESMASIGVERLGPRTFMYPKLFTDWTIPHLSSFLTRYFSKLNLESYLEQKDLVLINEGLKNFHDEYEAKISIQLFL